jgi:hypothetical protein
MLHIGGKKREIRIVRVEERETEIMREERKIYMEMDG